MRQTSFTHFDDACHSNLNICIDHLYFTNQATEKYGDWLSAMYILVPDYPTIQDTTTDLKMGPSNIYRRSLEFFALIEIPIQFVASSVDQNELIES